MVMLYFAYGRNLNIERNRHWRFIAKARLQDYEWMIENRGASTVKPMPGAETWGGIFEITDADLAVLDRIEGYPTRYGRQEMEFVVNGRPLTAWVYIEDNYLPGPAMPGYVEAIVAGLKVLEFPEDWVRYVSAYLPQPAESIALTK